MASSRLPIRFPRRFLLCSLCWLAPLSGSLAYNTLGPIWPAGSNIVMQLELGPTSVTLEDGSGTWDGSAADALSAWNPFMEVVQFSSIRNSQVPSAPDDGFNSVFFSDSVYGDDFGEDVLAITLLFYDENSGPAVEGDVVVNQAFQYNSYRGPLKPGSADTRIYDIHRIFLHEFGHVLGLAHPDKIGETVVAIMNSVITDLDHLAADDMAGAGYLYGIKIFADALNYCVGQPISYQIRTNIPGVSYEATNLPSGLTLDSNTGIISGAFSLSGTYGDGAVTVHGPKTTASSSLLFYVKPDPPGDLRAAYYFAANELTVDPVRNRIYAAVAEPAGVAIIDAVSLSLLKTIPVDGQPFGLAISPTGDKLFVGEFDPADVNPVTGVINLVTLSGLPNLPAAFPSRSLAATSLNRLFATELDQPLMAQIETVTGAISYPFSAHPYDALLALSPDQNTLYVESGTDSLLSYDVSGDSPILLQDVTFSYPSPLGEFKLSHDGSFILANGAGSDRVLKLSAGNFNITLAQYIIPDANLLGDGPVSGRIGAISPDDSTIFVTASYTNMAAFDVFDAVSGQYLRQVAMDDFFPSKSAVEPAGRYLFSAGKKENSISQLRVHSTGTETVPLHPPKAKSLLNVSTRLKSQSGNNVLIGGFIISGNEPKEVAVRGIGSSLPLTGVLADPMISLYDRNNQLVGSNDNWNSDRAHVLFTGLAPTEEHEAAMVLTLAPGSYTAIVSGADQGSGVALVEVYDLTPDSDSALANISTRGEVEIEDNVMIGGFIIGADTPTRVLLRAIGPSLTPFGVVGALQDPVLELHDGDGTLISLNDNWRSAQQADIIATGLAPMDDRESAVLATLLPGLYTAIVRGQNSTTGTALVEIYNLDSAAAAAK